jgi:hypothetical protein
VSTSRISALVAASNSRKLGMATSRANSLGD